MEERTRAKIYQLIVEGFRELGIPDVSLSCANMTILLRDQFIVGRRFHFDQMHVDWLGKENVIQFYDEDSKLLKSITVESDTSEKRKAA